MEEEKSLLQSHLPIVQGLRWIAVLPAAFLGYAVMQIIVLIAAWFNGEAPHWTQFISSIASPYSFVFLGAKTAPKFRLITAITLTTLHGVIIGVIIALAIITGISETNPNPLWWVIVCGIAGIAGTIIACVQIRQEE